MEGESASQEEASQSQAASIGEMACLRVGVVHLLNINDSRILKI